MWWIGTSAFVLLACLSLLGLAKAGKAFATVFLFCDICLLLLLALTAPCVSCLITAVFFVVDFMAFVRSDTAQARKKTERPRSSILAWIWLLLFAVNAGAVVRSHFGIWPILGEGELATTRMFFSPSCVYCTEGINALSGNVEVAFYPLSENSGDIFKIYKMQEFLDEGMSIAEALGRVQSAENASWHFQLNPSALLLHFRLLRNKAHVLASGSQAVPYFEHRGLPAYLQKHIEKKADSVPVNNPKPKSGDDYRDPGLPDELTSGQCVGNAPCPQ